MRQVIGLVLAAALLGGCAVYADPYSGRASAGIFHSRWRIIGGN